MEIITTHTNADLDALASMVAAKKLYPDAVMVFPGTLLRNVEEFMALHKDTLNIKTVKEIKPAFVQKVILVDTKTPGRLDKLAGLLQKPGVQIHIYDHHPRCEGDVRGDLEVISMVGATTTLLIEKIRELNLPVTPLEATVFALGIYEDTGSLTFSNTTSRDAEAVSFLLAQGANLSVVANFLDRPLTEKQRLLLKTLLVSAEHHDVNGIRFLLARGDTDEFVGGLDLLTHKLVDFAHLDAVFTVVEMEECVYVVARSSVPEVNVKDILEEIGGGGHPSAASAIVRKAKVEKVADRLLEIIRTRIKPPATASSIMSSPVKTITLNTEIGEAGRIMLRYGHSGLPVLKGEDVVGVISRRDVEKALQHGLGHAPVKGFMTNHLVSVSPEEPVSGVRELMIRHDIGRLPVLQEGKLVGIVSRTDVLRILHGEIQNRHQKVYSAYNHSIRYKNIRELLYRGLPEEYIGIMEQAGAIASRLGYRVYAAGGVVRDLLLGMECLDIDLVVEGDGIELAQALGQYYDSRVRIHPKFHTATVLFPAGQQVDVATARVEFYQYPAAMPQVETSSLHQDLYRRDFTINAMAVSLNDNDFGEIVDFFGGREDLERGLIRVLHNLSFIEDPIRLLRGVRFEKRYYMSLEPQTLKLAKEAVRGKMLAKVSRERIWEELKHILREQRPGLALSRLRELEIFESLFPAIDYTPLGPVLDELPLSLNVLRAWDPVERGEPWMSYLIVLLHLTGQEQADALCRHYNLANRQREKVNKTLGGWRRAVDSLSRGNGATMGELVKQVANLPLEAYPLLLTYLPDYASRSRFRKVLAAVYYDRPAINGGDLLSLGFKPGPSFKAAMEALWQARLDGLVRTRQEELSYVKEYLAGYEGAIKSV
ncbi:MAG: CCA-adding enzyme [Firmicutes bacterium ADurb.Bin456]|nr:MAG: CCA-adding enzyme [Firmicutes bacterium ADurb.Bin456]